MLSRRNVRVKVMQLLYAQRQDKVVTTPHTLRAYDRLIEESYQSLLFDLYVFVRVAQEATGEVERRNNRIRPTEADKSFKANLSTNPLVKALFGSAELAAVARKKDFEDLNDDERLRGFYEIIREVESYEPYAQLEQPTLADHLAIILKGHKALMDNEGYNDFIEDRFGAWDQDKSLVVGAAKKVFKALPQSAAMLSTYRPDDETRLGFGRHLLDYVSAHDTELQNHIEPVLENWDPGRVAILDMILIKMALSELLTFPQIPPKVTLNEYVELAKLYSTDKSKEFINGILDRLLHSLRDSGHIVKQGRGLIE